MHRLRISAETRDRLIRALAIYSSELVEIINAIEHQAKFAGRKGEEYIPKDLSDELRLTSDSRYIVNSFRDRGNQLFGENVREDQLRTMASALLLHRDDLIDRLRSVNADPLMPPEATSPLEDELSSLNENLESVFSPFGQSNLLDELRARRERKSGLAYPRNVDFAELIPEGEGQTIEFKENFPDQAHEIAKEMAAFGTSNPGIIFLGVADNGDVVGFSPVRLTMSRPLRTNSTSGVLRKKPVTLTTSLMS